MQITEDGARRPGAPVPDARREGRQEIMTLEPGQVLKPSPPTAALS
jgi:hypothetical protein